MCPLRRCTPERLPVRKMPLPFTVPAVEEMVKPLRSSVTLSALITIPFPVSTTMSPVRE